MMMCVINVYSYKDGEVEKYVSPPFGLVAYQAYNNKEIMALIRDPNNYSPSWGKSGIAFSIIYYIRNARLAIQYYSSPKQLRINDENHNEIWSKIFKWEMDIFSTFRAWFDDNRNDEKWKEFVQTVYDIFNFKLKSYLIHFVDSETFPIKMPIYREHGIGPKFLSLWNNNNIPSNQKFDKINPYIPRIFNNNFPLIGFGSWPITGEKCKESVLKALKTGYRLIDSSENYNNEEIIGEAIRESGIDRNQILIASKLSYNENYGESVTTNAFYKTLDNLGIDYIDIYMVHGAISDKKRLKESWLELENLYKSGKIKYLGVSNFDPNDMNELLKYASIKPMFIENKYDPFTQGQQTPWMPSIEEWVNNYNENIRKKDENIMIIQGYCLLNSWPHQVSAVNDKHIEWIANKYHVSSAQLLIRWALQHNNIGILTRSSKEERQLNNLNVFNFEINRIDMQLINGLNTLFSPFDIQWMHDVYGQVGNRPKVDPHQEL